MSGETGQPWKPVSGCGLLAGLSAFIAFLITAFINRDGFLLLDYVNLPFHEFGHLFFSIFGETAGISGGTIMQLLIPCGILANFFLRRETAGVAFSGLWLGESLLNISVYIADARRMELPLVGGGEHDWNIILSGLGMLSRDATIAATVRAAGRLIMITVVAWFAIRGMKGQGEQ